MMLMTTLDPSAEFPVVATLHTESNTQWDFLDFLIYLLEQQHLVAGDILFVDNASVHWGHDAFPIISALLRAAGMHCDCVRKRCCVINLNLGVTLFFCPNTLLSLIPVKRYLQRLSSTFVTGVVMSDSGLKSLKQPLLFHLSMCWHITITQLYGDCLCTFWDNKLFFFCLLFYKSIT